MSIRRDEADSALTRVHLIRLRKLWQSAGWPCRDNVELELLNQGYLDRHIDACGREVLTPSRVGLEALNGWRTLNRQRLDRHETLCRYTAEWVASQGRLAFLSTQFRARVNGVWTTCKPDVFSIRRATHEGNLMPIVYEIKVSRSDLLGDLAKPDKRAAYIELSTQMFYVLKAGIAKPEEIPDDCGVMFADGVSFQIARAAPVKSAEWPTAHWMSLVSADRIAGIEEAQQLQLA